MSCKKIKCSKENHQNSDSSSTNEEEEWYKPLAEEHGESAYYIGLGSWASHHSRTSREVDSVKPLSTLEAALIVSLLEDALDELIVLKYVIGAPIVSSWDFHYRSPAEKLRRRLTPSRIFPEVDSIPTLTSSIKLQRDREYIEMVVRKMIRLMLEDSSFTPLSNSVRDLRRMEEDDQKLIENLKRNLAHMKQLNAAVKEKRRLDDLEEKGRDEFMYQLQDELDDIKLKCDVEERFVNKWENVRNSQNQWRLRNAENYFRDGISKFTVQMKIEKRVTHELQMYLKITQAELENELEEWMTEYDSEMDRRENKIIHLKYERDQAEENKNRLRQLYEERKLQMKEWVTFRELRKRRITASLRIQNWWRGIMVRKKLGPYKPKKPRADKAKRQR